MLKEFREFALKGNVLDMAIGVIIGVAFGKIVSSLVDDIIMPPFGLLLGKVDFSSLFLDLSGTQPESIAAAKQAGAATINYGLFINHVISFLIVAWAVFFVVRFMNKLKKKPEALPTSSKECPYCCTQVALKATKCSACTSLL